MVHGHAAYVAGMAKVIFDFLFMFQKFLQVKILHSRRISEIRSLLYKPTRQRCSRGVQLALRLRHCIHV